MRSTKIYIADFRGLEMKPGPLLRDIPRNLVYVGEDAPVQEVIIERIFRVKRPVAILADAESRCNRKCDVRARVKVTRYCAEQLPTYWHPLCLFRRPGAIKSELGAGGSIRPVSWFRITIR